MPTAEEYLRGRYGKSHMEVVEEARVRKRGGVRVPTAEEGGEAWEDRSLGGEDFFYFAGEVWGLNQGRRRSARKNLVDLDVALHGEICAFLQRIEAAEETVSSLLIPRGHLKTSLCCAYVVWRIVRDPQVHVKYVHGNEEFAEQVMREIKAGLEGNERLLAAWPDVLFLEPRKQSTMWLGHAINVRGHDGTKVPTLTTSSLQSAQAGFHFDLVVVDDIVNETNYQSPTERKKGKDFFQHVDHTLKDERSRILDVGTRWHWDDAHGFLLDPQGVYAGQVRSFCRGVYGEPGATEGEPIFPALWPQERLLEKQRRSTTWEWSYQYLNFPTPEGVAVFRRADIRWFDLDEGGQPPGQGPFWYFLAVDPNRSEKTQHDPAVVMTVARGPDGNHWVVDIDRGHPTGPELVQWIMRQAERWEPQALIVESNNYQLQLCSWMREEMLKRGVAYNIIEAQRGPTARKHERISAMEPLVRAGGLQIRRGFDVLALEMEHFPSWTHDDCLDALADVWKHGKNPPEDFEKPEVPRSGFLMKHLLDGVRRGNWQARSKAYRKASY